RDDKQRFFEIDRLLDRPDLCGISAVQHVETWPAGPRIECFAEHFRTQARPAHPQEHEIGESALLDLLSKGGQSVDIGQLLVHDVEPAEPFALVAAGPQRCVAGPKSSNVPARTPDLLLCVARSLHLRRAKRYL